MNPAHRHGQFAIGLASQSWLMKRPPLLARQPKSGIRHPAAQRLARHPQTIALSKLLGCQARTKVRIAFAHDRQGIIPHTVANPIVRWPTNPLVPDRCCTIRPDPLQQAADLARA
jgi:hypothetical protein